MAYQTIILIATIFLAFVTNSRIGWLMGERWGCNDPKDFPWWALICGVIGALPFYWISKAGFEFGGMMGAFIVLVGTVPFSGFVWIFMVGGNKAIERVLNNLLKKVA
jgi:hypothetical protein